MIERKTTAEIIARLESSGDQEAADRLRALHGAYKHWKRVAKHERADWSKEKIELIQTQRELECKVKKLSTLLQEIDALGRKARHCELEAKGLLVKSPKY